MVESSIVKVTHVFGVEVVWGFTVQSALFKSVFHFLNVCENLFAGQDVLPYGHIERVDWTRQKTFSCFSMFKVGK